MRHLESCVRNAVSTREKREEYNDNYPMYCEGCEGWGGTITVSDPYLSTTPDLGDNSVEVDNCPDCIERGKCPRCGSGYASYEYSDDFDDSCSFCGFVLGVTEGKPYPHSCICDSLED